MKKRVVLAVLYSVIILLASYLFIHYIIIICENSKYFTDWLEYDKLAGNHGLLKSIIESFAKLILFALIDGVFIYFLVKVCKPSPKEKLLKEENNRIKIELAQRKEIEKTMLEIEKKEKEIEILKNKLN